MKCMYSSYSAGTECDDVAHPVKQTDLTGPFAKEVLTVAGRKSIGGRPTESDVCPHSLPQQTRNLNPEDRARAVDCREKEKV